MATQYEHLVQALSHPEPYLIKAVQNLFKRYEGIITDLNTGDQLFDKGINSDGVAIATYKPYATLTKQLKQQVGLPANRVTLYDTGAFHGAWFVEFLDRYIFFDSRDDKAEQLVEKYGESIFGLTEQSRQYVIEKILMPNILDEFLLVAGLK